MEAKSRELAEKRNEINLKVQSGPIYGEKIASNVLCPIVGFGKGRSLMKRYQHPHPTQENQRTLVVTNPMKTLKPGIIGALALFLAFSFHTFGIEGLKLTVHCPDVWLSWPSIEGEIYVVQYRETIDTNSNWITLTNALPAESGTNLTIFVHSNRVDCPTIQSFGMMMSSGGDDAWLDGENKQQDFEPTGPMVTPKDGSRAPVPLDIYPPGVDLSGYIVIWHDGSTDEWSKELMEKYEAGREEQQNGPQPKNSSGGSPGCGFYQVVRTGVHLFGITNGMAFSGVVAVPVEIGHFEDTLETVSITVDAVAIPQAQVLSAPFPHSHLIFDLNTGLLPNGTHSIQAGAQFISGSIVDENDDPEVSLRSDAIQVEVTNQISFPDWQEQFGEDACWFAFTSVYTNIDWQIDIYGTNQNYIGTLTNHSDDGIVDVQWNLVGRGGATNNDAWFASVTTVSSGGVLLAAAANPKKVNRPDHFPEQARWCVSRQNLSPGFEDAASFYFYMDAITDLGDATGGLLPPIPPRQSGQAYLMRYGTNVDSNLRKQDWDLLKVTASNLVVRNFYYFGHGSGTRIGGEYERTNSPFGLGDVMSSEDVATFLHIFNPRHPQYHPYRFVFLDGCETANGNWPERFGIVQKENVPITYYQKHKIRPSAFSGWTEKNYYAQHPPNRMIMNYAYYRSDFAFYWWLGGRTLESAHQGAYDGNPGPAQVASGRKIFGYSNLKYDQYNQAAQWP